MPHRSHVLSLFGRQQQKMSKYGASSLGSTSPGLLGPVEKSYQHGIKETLNRVADRGFFVGVALIIRREGEDLTILFKIWTRNTWSKNNYFRYFARNRTWKGRRLECLGGGGNLCLKSPSWPTPIPLSKASWSKGFTPLRSPYSRHKKTRMEDQMIIENIWNLFLQYLVTMSGWIGWPQVPWTWAHSFPDKGERTVYHLLHGFLVETVEVCFLPRKKRI